MLVLALVIFCLVVAGADRFVVRLAARAAPDVRAAPTAAGRQRCGERPTAQLQAFPCRIQDRWTALDDRQVARLLDDSAPC